MSEPLMKTRGAFDPPCKPLYWPIHLGISFAVCLLLAAGYAIVFLQPPTLFWLWPISTGTIILTVVRVVKEAME